MHGQPVIATGGLLTPRRRAARGSPRKPGRETAPAHRELTQLAAWVARRGNKSAAAQSRDSEFLPAPVTRRVRRSPGLTEYHDDHQSLRGNFRASMSRLPLRRERLADAAHLLQLSPADPRISRIEPLQDRKSTRLNSSHANISYAVFCLKKK